MMAGLAPAARPRRLLVVAFHYPPDNTSTGVLRTLKFTQYLRDHGWQCDVLSVPETLYPSIDHALLSTVPADTQVHRSWAADAARAVSLRGRYPSLIAFPDRYWPWLLSAVPLGRKLLAQGRHDAIYSTYPVATAHLVAGRLAAASGLPWIADYRDPWVEDSMPRWRRWAEGRLERGVMQGASRVICNTPAMRRYFLARYGDLPAEKFVTVSNGYDETDFAGLQPAASRGFELIYPGVLVDGNRNPEPLLKAIRLALDRGWLDAGDLHLSFLGCGHYGASRAFSEMLDRYRLRQNTEVVIDRIPYREALSRVAAASVLVVLSEVIGGDARARALQSWSRLQVPAKTYEYLRIGRPMLALVSEGAVAELLESTGAARPVAPTDTEAVAAALRDLYASRHAVASGIRAAAPPVVAAYSREALAGRLAQVLDGSVSHAAG